MSELIVRDDGQLRRVESAIAAIECRPACDQMRMINLLHALHAERSMLEVSHGRRRVRRR
ncbi:MAG TPA: hypothetical protein VMB81_04530 [Candidatus Sulfotelmatobacter sp.]|nr:hypothetical protein [Candidatus Sulfotelmatobacter sp.]